MVFFHDLSENQLHFLEKWVLKKLWALEVIYFLLRKTIFSYSSMLYISIHWKDFVFVSWISGGEIYISLEINPLL